MSINYGDSLRKFRSERGWTRKELSEMTGLSVSRIGDLENNRYKDPTKSLKALFQELDYNFVDFLVNYAGVTTSPSNPLSEQERAELEHKNNIIDSQIGELVEVVDFIQNEATQNEFQFIKEVVDFIKWKKEQNKKHP